MEELNYLFRVLTLSQVLLLVASLVAFERHREGMLIAMSAIAFGCYLMLPFTESVAAGWRVIPIVIATVIPSLLWLLAYWFFNDARNIPRWLIALTVVYAGLWTIPEQIQSAVIANNDVRLLVFSLLPQVLKLLLVIHVVYMALAGQQADLVDARLRWRKPIAIGAGALAGLVIIVEIWSGGPTPIAIEAAGSILMFALMLAANVYLFRFWLHLTPPRQVPVHKPASEAELSDEALRVIAAMEEARLYANHGITLADLSSHLQMPVHRLREVINKELGHRNFNQFLNQYRIEEAADRLRNEKHLPILSIALDVGFKSLSSFNAAFRQIHGMTPGEFRARQD